MALTPESQPESRPHRSSGKPFTAKELFDILQTAITVQFYAAKHREKGAKLKEFGNAVRALNIQGSDDVFKARIKDLLAYHEVHSADTTSRFFRLFDVFFRPRKVRRRLCAMPLRGPRMRGPLARHSTC
jgi:hypothetical protein